MQKGKIQLRKGTLLTFFSRSVRPAREISIRPDNHIERPPAAEPPFIILLIINPLQKR
jgi:hypothetical protein